MIIRLRNQSKVRYQTFQLRRLSALGLLLEAERRKSRRGCSCDPAERGREGEGSVVVGRGSLVDRQRTFSWVCSRPYRRRTLQMQLCSVFFSVISRSTRLTCVYTAPNSRCAVFLYHFISHRKSQVKIRTLAKIHFSCLYSCKTHWCSVLKNREICRG